MVDGLNYNECNDLIAEFIGVDIHFDKDVYRDSRSPLRHHTDNLLKSAGLRFHCDWNWLIEVVEHIEKGNYGIKMCRKVVEIYFDDTKEVILKTKEKSRTDSLYKAIVEFVKWHNELKK